MKVRQIIQTLAIAIGVYTSIDSQGSACTIIGPPATAQEIVERAEVIVRAEAVSYSTQKEYRGVKSGEVTFKVLEVLKGTGVGEVLTLHGQADHYWGPNREAPPYNHVRPGGSGGCYARDYELGKQYLILLREGVPNWASLAATNEEVSGPNDPWVWWVKGYLAGQQGVEKRLTK